MDHYINAANAATTSVHAASGAPGLAEEYGYPPMLGQAAPDPHPMGRLVDSFGSAPDFEFVNNTRDALLHRLRYVESRVEAARTRLAYDEAEWVMLSNALAALDVTSLPPAGPAGSIKGR